MNIDYLPRALQALKDAPADCARRSLSKSRFLPVTSTTHRFTPRSTTNQEVRRIKDRWQARINKNWRFYFNIVGNTYVIRDIIPHPKK
jgi:hypothetical protein